jgi:3',5'-cyclic AMP phosphodiesterase CpdA
MRDGDRVAGIFRLAIFSDLLLSSDPVQNQATLNFVNSTLFYYSEEGDYEGNDKGIDLVVILGNAVNGSAWDGLDPNFFQDRWDMLM